MNVAVNDRIRMNVSPGNGHQTADNETITRSPIMKTRNTTLRILATFAIATLITAASANAALLAYYVDGTDAGAAALVNLTTPSGYTASSLSSVGITARTTTPGYHTPDSTEWLVATSNEVARIDLPVSTDDYYQFNLAGTGGNTIAPDSLTFDWALIKWGDSGGITGYYQIFSSTDGATFSAVGSGGSITLNDTPPDPQSAGPEAQNIDLTGLSAASSYTFRLALSDNSGNVKKAILLQNIKLNGDVAPPELEWTGAANDGDWANSTNWSGTWGADGTGHLMTINTSGSDVTMTGSFNAAYGVNLGATNESTLTVNGNLTVDNGVDVGPNGTLKGNGTITGALTVTGNVAPGSSIGTITVETGPATFTPNSTYEWEFANPTDIPNADLIDVNGMLTIPATASGTINLELLPFGAPLVANTDVFTLFEYTSLQDSDLSAIGASVTLYDGIGGVDDYFTILTPVNGSKFDLSGLIVRTNAAGSAIEITGFSYIPEPSTAILAGLGLAGLTLRRRRG